VLLNRARKSFTGYKTFVSTSPRARARLTVPSGNANRNAARAWRKSTRTLLLHACNPAVVCGGNCNFFSFRFSVVRARSKSIISSCRGERARSSLGRVRVRVRARSVMPTSGVSVGNTSTSRRQIFVGRFSCDPQKYRRP